MKKVLLVALLTLSIFLSYSQIIKYRVDQKKCITCGYCVQTQVCPVKAIHIIHGKAVIDRELCIGCKQCVVGNQINYRGCPVKAFGPESTSKLIKNMIPKTHVINSSTSNSKVIINNGVKANQVAIKKDEASSKSITTMKRKISTNENNIDKSVASGSEQQVFSYKVDPIICIGCQLCVKNCPVKAIDFVNNKAIIDQSKCIHCGICMNGNGNDFAGCPVSAISRKPFIK